MAINQLLYTTNVKGGIATVGNTLGLWGSFNPPNPAAPADATPADGIGAFTTIDTGQVFDGYPAGTTNNWQLNSSSNILTLPSGSTILKAYLFYSAVAKNGSQDVTGSINSSVTFTPPSGIPIQIAPENVVTIVDTFSSNTDYHVRTDITALMQGSGNYTLGAVPGCLGLQSASNITESNYAGWTIVVAYSNPNQPLRNINIWDEFDFVAQGASINIPVSGFQTPSTTSPQGKLFISVASGDNYLAGDQVKFGPNAGLLTNLSGPNNGQLNFFQSQINNDNGALSTTGTFGSRNQPYGGNSAANISPAARQGWDKTAIDISSTLVQNQTAAVINLLTTRDVYLPQYAALQINLDYATLKPTKTVSKVAAIVGDILTYSVSFTNTGTTSASNVVITDPIPSGTSYVNNSLSVNVPSTGTPLTTIRLTNPVLPGETVTISYKVQIITLPNPNPIPNTANVTYNYLPSQSSQPISDNVNSNTVTTLVFDNSRGVEFL